MKQKINLILATETNAEHIYQMQYESFLPLYEKYHDDETNPVKESLDNVLRKIQPDKSNYFLIEWQQQIVGAVRVVERTYNVFSISPLFILPAYQNFCTARVSRKRNRTDNYPHTGI